MTLTAAQGQVAGEAPESPVEAIPLIPAPATPPEGFYGPPDAVEALPDEPEAGEGVDELPEEVETGSPPAPTSSLRNSTAPATTVPTTTVTFNNNGFVFDCSDLFRGVASKHGGANGHTWATIKQEMVEQGCPEPKVGSVGDGYENPGGYNCAAQGTVRVIDGVERKAHPWRIAYTDGSCMNRWQNPDASPWSIDIVNAWGAGLPGTPPTTTTVPCNHRFLDALSTITGNDDPDGTNWRAFVAEVTKWGCPAPDPWIVGDFGGPAANYNCPTGAPERVINGVHRVAGARRPYTNGDCHVKWLAAPGSGYSDRWIWHRWGDTGLPGESPEDYVPPPDGPICLNPDGNCEEEEE